MIILAYDHRAFVLMQKVKAYFVKNNIEYKEFASKEYTKSDSYSNFAKLANAELVSHPEYVGLYSCRTGIGITMAANRQKGVRAGLCHTDKQVFLARNDDNMNVLVVPATICFCKLKKMLKTFLQTPFEGGRHLARVNALDE